MKIRVPFLRPAAVPAKPVAALLCVVMLSGCTVYQSIGKSVGAFLHPVSGHDFVHIDNDQWDQNNALLYFYRTHSQRSEEHTSELQSRPHLVCRLLLEKKNMLETS